MVLARHYDLFGGLYLRKSRIIKTNVRMDLSIESNGGSRRKLFLTNLNKFYSFIKELVQFNDKITFPLVIYRMWQFWTSCLVVGLVGSLKDIVSVEGCIFFLTATMLVFLLQSIML